MFYLFLLNRLLRQAFCLFLASCLFIHWESVGSADTVNFDELNVWTSIGSDGSYYNGDRGVGSNNLGWSSGNVYFGNSFVDTAFGGYWNGFSYSNVSNTTTPGFVNEYAAYAGGGVGGQGNYAVAFGFEDSQAFFNLPGASTISSVYLTNTTYAALSMENGDQFAKKFGGNTGDEADYFSVTFTGYDSLNGAGNVTGAVEFYLADFRFVDNSLDYIIDQWTSVDMSALGLVQSVRLSFQSSDVGQFGINTPTYVALDNLVYSTVAIPEPTSGGLGVLLISMLWLRRRDRPGVAA